MERYRALQLHVLVTAPSPMGYVWPRPSTPPYTAYAPGFVDGLTPRSGPATGRA